VVAQSSRDDHVILKAAMSRMLWWPCTRLSSDGAWDASAMVQSGLMEPILDTEQVGEVLSRVVRCTMGPKYGRLNDLASGQAHEHHSTAFKCGVASMVLFYLTQSSSHKNKENGDDISLQILAVIVAPSPHLNIT